MVTILEYDLLRAVCGFDRGEESTQMTAEDTVNTVRLQVLHTARDTGRVPDAGEVARALGLQKQDIVDAYRQLHDGHVFVLEPGTTERLRMANPFSAVPTPFRVHVGERSWWANCVWDGLGLIAALGGNGVLATTCADCGQPEAVVVADSMLTHGSGVAYIGLPARAWWDNIIYT
jgi:hypothetical protein